MKVLVMKPLVVLVLCLAANQARSQRFEAPYRFGDREYVNQQVDQYIAVLRKKAGSPEEERARARIHVYMSFAAKEVEVIKMRESLKKHQARRQELREAGRGDETKRLEKMIKQIKTNISNVERFIAGEMTSVQGYLMCRSECGKLMKWKNGAWHHHEGAREFRRYYSKQSVFFQFGQRGPEKIHRVINADPFISHLKMIQRKSDQSAEWKKISQALGRAVDLAKANKCSEVAAYRESIWHWVLAWNVKDGKDFPTVDSAGSASNVVKLASNPVLKPIRIKMPASVDLTSYRLQLKRLARKKTTPSKIERGRLALQRRFVELAQAKGSSLTFDDVHTSLGGPFRLLWCDLRQGRGAHEIELNRVHAIRQIDRWLTSPRPGTASQVSEVKTVRRKLLQLDALMASRSWGRASALLQECRAWLLKGSPIPLH